MKYLYLFIFLLVISCDKENEKLIKNSVGFIVGFDPCTINHQYRIGYIFISEDLKDTLVTYNISDETFKMPANILLNSNDTIYKITEEYFQNFRACPYFPISERYKYKVEISYSLAKENEMIYYLCTTDILFLNFKQIVVKSIKKE